MDQQKAEAAIDFFQGQVKNMVKRGVNRKYIEVYNKHINSFIDVLTHMDKTVEAVQIEKMEEAHHLIQQGEAAVFKEKAFWVNNMRSIEGLVNRLIWVCIIHGITDLNAWMERGNENLFEQAQRNYPYGRLNKTPLLGDPMDCVQNSH